MRHQNAAQIATQIRHEIATETASGMRYYKNAAEIATQMRHKTAAEITTEMRLK